MPIRYPIAFRGTARPSVCSVWRLKVPKIEHLTHPKPYVVPKLGALPKPFARFSLICSSRNPISCRKLGVLPKPFACFSLICSRRNPISCRKLGVLPKPFDCFSLICSRRNPISCRNSVFFRNLLIVSALFAQGETLYRAETRCSSETFCLFLPYLFKSKPSFFVELGAVVHQREISVRFRHQRNLQAFFVTFCLFAFWRN